MGDPDIAKLLHGDGHGHSPHAGGHGQDGDSPIGASKGAVFPVEAQLLRLLQLLGDTAYPGGIAGKDGVLDVQALIQLNVGLYHGRAPPFMSGKNIIVGLEGKRKSGGGDFPHLVFFPSLW